jgi:hypothetical protein
MGDEIQPESGEGRPVTKTEAVVDAFKFLVGAAVFVVGMLLVFGVIHG